jgi:PAS domain S-box-containing protein
MELSSIYDTAPVGLAVLDTNLRFLRINERLAALNGRSVGDHIGRTVAEVVPDVAPQAEAVLRRILATGEPLRDVEIRGQVPSMPGVERVWLEQFTPLRDETGRIVAISVVAEEVTGKRDLEEQVRKGQERLALALEAARLVMWEWRLDTGETAFPHGDLGAGLPRSIEAFRHRVHPDDRRRVDACLEHHLSGACPVYECEFRVRADDSGYRWILSRGRVTVRDASGRPLVLTGFRQDITARKESEAALREQGQLLELASDAIFVWSLQGGIERWNRGAERIYGYSAREALGQRTHELLRTEYPVPLAQVAGALARDGIWRGTLLHRRKDGTRIRVEALMQRVEGRPEHVMEITRDVTAEREAADRLAASERELQTYRNRLEIALEAGRMGVWEWVPGSEDSFWSPQIFGFAGLPPTADGRASTTRFLELVEPQDRPALDAQLARVLATGGDYEVEFRLRPVAGQVRWLLSRGRVLHDGDVSRLIGINLDVTQQKALEQTLRESDARRNEFLAMLGHELRNPLAPITNAVHLLERAGALEPRQVAAVQIIRRQSQHMARLVDDLLEVSRITQGRIELRMENLLVATAVHAAIETARPLARTKSQALAVEVPPELDVVADPARLTQILSNLIVNAVKYTPAGGHIRVLAREAGDRFVEIQVSDDGMGISPELQTKVFELFTQDRRTLDRSEGGLGLGLALVKQLVELHGGRVECESAGAGQGATFTVCLPRRGRREEARGGHRHAASTRIAPTRFLIVDDNRDAAETLASLLRMDGHRVTLAFDGMEALDAAAREVPEVVVLDIGLPRMNGLEVARRLRGTPELRGAVIIGVSGYARSDDRLASRAAGFDAHLAKPAGVADIYGSLAELRG